MARLIRALFFDLSTPPGKVLLAFLTSPIGWRRFGNASTLKRRVRAKMHRLLKCKPHKAARFEISVSAGCPGQFIFACRRTSPRRGTFEASACRHGMGFGLFSMSEQRSPVRPCPGQRRHELRPPTRIGRRWSERSNSLVIDEMPITTETLCTSLNRRVPSRRYGGNLQLCEPISVVFTSEIASHSSVALRQLVVPRQTGHPNGLRKYLGSCSRQPPTQTRPQL